MAFSYRTTMASTGRNTGIPVPDEALAALAGGRRPAVEVTVNGFRFTSTVGAMGGRSLIPFSAARREESGIAGGDDLDVELRLDEAPRDTPVPDDLAAALDAGGGSGAFEALSPSRRKAHVTSVEGAKTPETRARRIAAVVAAVAPGSA